MTTMNGKQMEVIIIHRQIKAKTFFTQVQRLLLHCSFIAFTNQVSLLKKMSTCFYVHF